MRIGIVIESYLPEAGGNERSTDQIARRLIARGHHVTIITNRADDDPDFLPGGAVRIADLPKTSRVWGLLRFRRWAMHQLNRGEFDATLSMTTAVPADVVQPRGGTYRETLARNVAMRAPGLPRAAKRVGIALNPKQIALLWAERQTLASWRLKRLAAISPYVCDQLFYGYTIPPRRVELIPNASAVTPMDESQRREARHALRSRIGLGEDDVVFLFAAMNPALKGLEPLLQALSRLTAARPPVRLLVAGTLHYAFQHRAEQLGVRDMIRWLGPTSQMATLFAAADATVHPTYFDPSSKVVIESLLHGMPTISTLYNGASQWIEDPTGEMSIGSRFSPQLGRNAPRRTRPRAGRVIESPDDIDDLTQAVTDLCDADERARCAEATRQLDPRLNMDRHVEALEALLNKVQESDRRRGDLRAN